MGEFDFFTTITLVVLMLHLLQLASQKMAGSKWLAPFSFAWVISGLLCLMPLAEKGSAVAIAASYLLISALILNTAVLYFCSRLPNHLIPLKSFEIELIGGSMLKLMGAGLGVVGRALLRELFQWIDVIIAPRSTLVRFHSI
jgi:hypothetical protein